MQIQSVHFRPISIPLNFQFKQSNNSGTSKSLSAIVELHTAEGVIGYGESCPRTYVTGERMVDVTRDVARLNEELGGKRIDTPEALVQQLGSWAKNGIGPSARCAVELAWLDAWSRTQQASLGELLGITYQESLAYSLILPLVSPGTLEQLLKKIAVLQPPAIKLKAGQDQEANLAKVRLLQDHFGPAISIRLDVNGGWTFQEAQKYIPDMLALGVNSFEQVVEPKDLESMQELTRLFGSQARIMADESLLTLDGAKYLLEKQICNHFNLKISKLGGIFSSLEIYKLAQEYGVPCQLGAHFGETSLLTSAGAILAGLVKGELSACEGALGEFLLSRDISQPSIRQAADGSLSLAGLWNKPGLVDQVQQDRLDAFTFSLD